MPTRSVSGKIQTVKGWCRQFVPLVCLARYLSDRPLNWLFLWVGYAVLHRTVLTPFFLDAACDDGERETLVKHADRNYSARSEKESDTHGTPESTSASTITLATLPSVVLSNLGCYLHPRDALDFDAVLRSAAVVVDDDAKARRESDDGEISHRGGVDEAVLRDVWKRIWYRDYGDVLLRWKVSRQAFGRSLLGSPSQSTGCLEGEGRDDRGDGWIDERLSDLLDELSTKTTMKEFYFVFGECYLDYVLARRNKIDECYLGLHGHIFNFTDFAEYHPGLIEPILKKCGGDATYFFEDVPHSSGARNIARRLCVVVDHGVLGDRERTGLELLVRDDDDDSSRRRKRALRSSNTTPLLPEDQKRDDWMSRVLPRRRHPEPRPTLERIRTRFQRDRRANSFRSAATFARPSWNLNRLTTNAPESRFYYDPLLQKWVGWET